jgi:Repeat of unknown function (DUF5907)
MAYPESLPDTAAANDPGHISDHNTIVTAVTNIDTRLNAHEVDTVDAHDASAISTSGHTGNISGATTVEAALDLIDDLALGGAPSGAAGGDLSGTYPNPSVAKVAGVAVTGTPTAGQVPIASSGTAAAWGTLGGGAPSGAAGGDLAGTYPNPTVATDAVTYAKMQNVSATSRVLGRVTAGAGDVEELTAANLTTIAGGSSATTLAVGNHTHTAVYSGSVSWGIDGAVTVRTGKARIYNDSGRTRTLVSARATVDTAPTGASLIVDINKGGSSVMTTRPTIAVSTNTNKSTAFSDATWPDGTYLTVDVDQIGSTVAGSDLAVTVEWS